MRAPGPGLDEERIPVVVAGGQCIERDEPLRALDLAERATTQVLSVAPGLRDRIERVSVVSMLSPGPKDPASALCRRLGIEAAQREVSTIGGNSPQWLVSRAAADIAAGRLRATLIAGAEAQYSQRRGPAEGPETDGAGGEDPVVGDDRSGVGPAELAAGLIAPVHVYAMFESVLAGRAGRDFAQHRRALGDLMAPFTEVAARHPAAWYPVRRTPDDLATVSTDNRLVAEPYPKRMCAVLAVDQGAAVLVTSLAEARRAGVAERSVFVSAGAQVNDVWFPSARPDPGSSPAMAAAASATLAAAGIGLDDVDAFDLYSCFPCVVEMACNALGIEPDDRRGLTVTGGLPYFGGPGNNYTLHSIATMTDRLREAGGTALVSGLGWYSTKHAYGLYAAHPPERGWQAGDVADAQARIDATAVEVADTFDGTATVVSATVVGGGDSAPTAAPVVARIADGRHIVAAAERGALAELAGVNLVGTAVTVEGGPPRYRPA
ncbi:MAG: acetyl-CoA acetyltransferase [Acidimicrobiales bacterium]